MAGLIANDGSTNVTMVSGLFPVGLHAADGAYNVIVVVPSGPKGLQHACGALNVTVATSPPTSFLAPDGSMYVDTAPYTNVGNGTRITQIP